MRFQLNFKSGKPVYLQLVDQVKAAAASGAVQPGEPLPSIRPLAEELRVNRNTVAKAYTELESQRIIETIAGKGCFVRAGTSPFRKDVRLKLLTDGNRRTPSSRRTTCRSPSASSSSSSKSGSTRSTRSGRAPRRHEAYEHTTRPPSRSAASSAATAAPTPSTA